MKKIEKVLQRGGQKANETENSSILIDYFHKTDKSNSNLIAHFKQYDQLLVSTITEFEVYNAKTA